MCNLSWTKKVVVFISNPPIPARERRRAGLTTLLRSPVLDRKKKEEEECGKRKAKDSFVVGVPFDRVSVALLACYIN